MKATVVERVIWSLKNMISGVLLGIYGKDVGHYTQFLDLIVERYNESPHKGLDYNTPQQIYYKTAVLPLWFLYKDNFKLMLRLKKDTILREGTKVRVSILKNKFAKESRLSWSGSVYVIDKVLLTDPVTYKLKDMNGDVVSVSFYREELQKSK